MNICDMDSADRPAPLSVTVMVLQAEPSVAIVIFPSGCRPIASIEFLMMLISACSNSTQSISTISCVSLVYISSFTPLFEHIDSKKPLHSVRRLLRSVGRHTASGIFTTSAYDEMNLLIAMQREEQASRASDVSATSLQSDSFMIADTVPSIDVMPATELFTSCEIMRITFS